MANKERKKERKKERTENNNNEMWRFLTYEVPRRLV
jgi:hypothetical protein